MSSQPLAIKYRPHQLSDVIGQVVPTRTLLNTFNDNSWSTSFLLYGQSGSGKTTIARIMAAMENCKTGPTIIPCGTCQNCKDIFEGKSWDIKEMDAASNRGIDDIRDIKKDAESSPLSCRTKYYIVDECHGLSDFAADALLKLIEEPPKNTRIILCTTDPQQLKPTLQSRCISLGFGKVNWMDISSHLLKICQLENIAIDEDATKFIAKSSKGSVRKSLQSLQSVSGFAGKDKITLELAMKALGGIDESVYFNLMDAITEINTPKAMLIIDELFISGKNVEVIMTTLGAHLRSLMLARTCGEKIIELGYTDDECKRYCHQAQNISPGVVAKMMDLMIDVQKAVAVNLDAQTFLEKVVIQTIINIIGSKGKK